MIEIKLDELKDMGGVSVKPDDYPLVKERATALAMVVANGPVALVRVRTEAGKVFKKWRFTFKKEGK